MCQRHRKERKESSATVLGICALKSKQTSVAKWLTVWSLSAADCGVPVLSGGVTGHPHQIPGGLQGSEMELVAKSTILDISILDGNPHARRSYVLFRAITASSSVRGKVILE